MSGSELLLTAALLVICVSGAVCVPLWLRVHRLEKWRDGIQDVAREILGRG